MRDLLGDILHGGELDDCPFFARDKVVEAFNLHLSTPETMRLPVEQALMIVGHTCLMQRIFKLGS